MARYVLVPLSVAVLALAGCAGGAGGGDKLEFQTGLGAGDPTLDVLEEVTGACTPDGVEIDLVPQTNTYEADMRTRLASRDAPDIWATHGWSLLRYGDFLEPLDKRPWAEAVNPALEPAMQGDDGEFYALPINTDVAGIVYNEDVLAAAGIDVATLTSWDAFSSALGTLKAAGVIPISSSSKDSWMAGNVADFMVSGAYDDAARKELKKGTFVADGYTTMLEQISAWATAGYVNPDFASATLDDIGRSLAEGDTGFVFVQNYLVATALDINPDARLGFFPVPSFSGDPYLVGGEGTAYGVSRESARKKEALEYLDGLAEPDNLAELAKAVGGAPGLTDADVDLGPLQPSYDRWVADGVYELEPYFDRVYLPNGMWDTMVTTTSSVIAGQGGVPNAVEQMEQQFGSLYGQE